MKKTLCLVGLVCLGIVLVGCGKSSKKESLTVCTKDYNGSSYKYEFTFKEDKLIKLINTELTEITSEDEVDSRFEFVKGQVPAMEKIYPNAKIESLKDGNKVGIKIEFDFANHEFVNLNLGFNEKETAEQITNSMKQDNYNCEVK